MAQTFVLKNSDVIVKGYDYDYHFPIANLKDLVFPVIVKDNIGWSILFLVGSLAWTFLFSDIIYLFFLDKQYVISVSLIATLTVGFFQVRHLFFYNKMVISEDGLRLPTGYFGKIINLSYAQIYDIHLNRILLYRGANYTIYIHYLEDVTDYKTCKKIIFWLNDEVYAQKMTAIARTAMLNYHQKHNITNLPKVKFIQQK